MTIVFDAPKQPEGVLRGHQGPLEVVYTSSGESADDYIISLLDVPQSKNKMVVVTSDQQLMRRAKQAGARVMAVETFLRHKKKYKKGGREEKSEFWDTRSTQQSLPVSSPSLDETASRYLSLFTNNQEPSMETEFERWLRLFEARLEKNEGEE